MKLKKLLSLVLCVAMVLSTMSFNVFAEEAEVEVIEAGVYKNIPVPVAGKTLTIKAAEGADVVFNMDTTEHEMAAGDARANITFEGITFNWDPTADYKGLVRAGNMKYIDCTINGKVFLYGESETFVNCTFNQKVVDYNVWTYSAKNVEFNKCTFNCEGKSVLVYNEGANGTKLNVIDTDFIAKNPSNGKAAIEIDGSLLKGNDVYSIVIDEASKAEGFAAGNESGNTLWNNKKGAADGASEVTVNGEKVLELSKVFGDGTEQAPYVISNLSQFKTFRDNVNAGATYAGKLIKLTNDIDLNNEEWTPIGNSTYSFQGTFDGDNHTISNLKITGNNSNAGLFGFTTNGEIKNLTVENASVSGRLNVGVVAGTPYTSKYTNITVTGHVEVNGMAYVGGVGGKNAYANWTNITVDVDNTSYVKATSTENGTAYRTYVGGVIGFMGEGGHTVANVTSNIAVIGDVCDVGGIVGIAHYGNNFVNVTCSGAVTNTNTDPENTAETGGIAGVWHNQEGQKVTFENCEYTGTSNVALVGAAYNANDITADSSGSLIIDGNTSWPSVARIGMTGYASLKDAVDAAKDGDTIQLIAGVTIEEGELAIPDVFKNITIKGAKGASLKNTHLVSRKVGAVIEGLTIDGVVFDNSHVMVVAWDNNTSLKDWTIINSTFKNLDAANNEAALHLNVGVTVALENLTFKNNVVQNLTGGDKSGIYGQYTGNILIENNVFDNIAFRPYLIQLTSDDGIADSLIVTGNTFSGSSQGRAQALTNNAEGTDSVDLVVTNNIFKDITSAQQICYWNFNDATTTTSFAYNYYDINVEEKANRFYYNKAAANGSDLVDMGIFPFYTELNEDGTIDTSSIKNADFAVAMIEDAPYMSITKAIEAAKAGDVIKLSKNVTESVIVKALAATYSLRSTATGVTIDLNKFTLTGDITVNSDAAVTIKNGTIINENSGVSAIQTYGTTTLEDVDVTSARHAVRVEGGRTTINSGSYKVGTAGMTTHAVNVSDGGNVVIYGGVFEGPANTEASDSGAAVNVQAGSTAKIYGGKFSGGKLNTLAGGGITVYEGMFDQDPAAYIAPTSEAIDRGAYEYPYGVAPKAAAKINVELKETSNKNVYDIVINSDGAYNIYEFVSAELTFANNSTTVGGSYMDYEIRGYATNKTFAQEAKDAVNLKDNEEQYIISLNDGAERLSGDGIIIGQVEFFGQGTLDFSITKAKVATTWQNTNLGRYYDAAAGTLVLKDAAINDNIPEVHRNVAVNVAFNHNIDTENHWGDYKITATLKNNAMGYTETKDVTIKDIKSGACLFENVPVGYITVTLKAPGFRTYTYETTLEETKDNGVLVLNFWNDVKRGNDEAIEKGKATMAHNFVVGDIVMDMKVDKYDLAAVTSYYGMYNIENNAKYIKYDLNRDGDIDIRDVQYVLHTMGK